jgi:hypothetical protein
MSLLDGTLHELARLRSSDEPIVSLYLDVRRRDERWRERVRLFVSDGIRQALQHHPSGTAGREPLARTLERVREHVAGLTDRSAEQAGDGLALFACESLGLWRPLPFHRTFQPELCLDRTPHLVQLARLAEAQPPTLVIAPDAEGADLYQVVLGGLAVEERLRQPEPWGGDGVRPGAVMPGRHFERAEKNVRHAKDAARKSRHWAVAEAAALFEREPGTFIVLVGTAENLATFERELPATLQAAIIARLPRPREWEEGEGARRTGVVTGAAEAAAEHERRMAERRVAQLVREASRGGLAALGPADVAVALNEGRVLRLVLEEGFARGGWRCGSCDALGAERRAVERCPYCGGQPEPLENLGEALVVRTLGGGGAVDVVPPTELLNEHLSVGALLRHQAGAGQAAQP